MMMTAKVDIKKIAIILAIIAGAILGLVLLIGGGDDTSETTATVTDNDSRVAFLESFGWDVDTSPTESGQVRIPTEPGDVFTRYNALQKSQGYDLNALAGQSVMRYVYKINNYPGATAPVYATVLVHKNQVVGGDITDTSAKGKVQGFTMPQVSQTTPTASAPEESTPPAE